MFDNEIADSKDWVFLIMSAEPDFLKQASERIKNDKGFLRLAVLNYGTDILQYAGDEVKKDKEFMAELLSYKSEFSPTNEEIKRVKKK